MKCPNCNFKMKRNFCTHCGYMTNGNFINTKKLQEDSLLELYFGKNYEKITSNNNYIVPFIIGPVYIFCHDFYIEGIILILIEYLISTIFLCFNHAFLYVYVVKLLNLMYFAFSRLIWATILNLIYEKLTLRRLKKIKEKDKNYKETIQELYKKDNSLLILKYIVFTPIFFIIFVEIISYIYSHFGLI